MDNRPAAPRWWMGFLSCLLGIGGLLFVLVCALLHFMADDDLEMTSLATRYLPLMALPNLIGGFTLGLLGRLAEARGSLPGILVSGAGMIVAALLLTDGYAS